MLHRTFLNFVFFQRAYQSALSLYSNTDAFQRDLTIFRVSTFPCCPPRRGILLSPHRWRGQHEENLGSPEWSGFSLAAISQNMCSLGLAVAASTDSMACHDAVFSLPSAFFKQFLRIRNAKSFYFLPRHIYEWHFYIDLCYVENCKIKSGTRVNEMTFWPCSSVLLGVLSSFILLLKADPSWYPSTGN